MGNFIWGIIVAVVVLAYVSDYDPKNKAIGEIVLVEQVEDTGMIDGEVDYGVRVKTRVKNAGQEGFIKIQANLSTSEGEWTREQKLHFDAGQSRELTWFFSEPTINVSNVESWVYVSPGHQKTKDEDGKEPKHQSPKS